MKTSPTAARQPGTLQTLDSYRQAVNEALEAFLDTMPGALGFYPEALSAGALGMLAKLREYTLRPGKRIRGSLAAAAYDDAKGTHLGKAGIALGVAQELIQSYLLITDDVTDRSDLRRGKPTVHEEYMAERDEFGDDHESNMLAIYVGMIGDHLANMALLQAPEQPGHIADALHSLHGNLVSTAFGQVDDMRHKTGRVVTRDDIIRVYSLKTGYYTFVNPLQSGLRLAGVSDMEAEQHIKTFGKAAGIAFQLHDDYLGVFGDTAATGKQNVDDLQEGKYTMLVQYALEHGKPGDVTVLKSILGSAEVTPADLSRAQQIFNISGATLYTQTQMHEYARLAKRQLATIAPWSEPFRAFLADLIDYAISRKT